LVFAFMECRSTPFPGSRDAVSVPPAWENWRTSPPRRQSCGGGLNQILTAPFAAGKSSALRSDSTEGELRERATNDRRRLTLHAQRRLTSRLKAEQVFSFRRLVGVLNPVGITGEIAVAVIRSRHRHKERRRDGGSAHKGEQRHVPHRRAL